MHIDHLDIQNFRCFEYRSFAFDPRFTLLVGANGTGKTATLDALAVALGAALIPVPVRNKGISHRDVRRTYRFTGETGHFVEHYPARIEARGSVGEKELVWARELKSAESQTTREGAYAIRQVMGDLVRRSTDNDHIVFPYIGYYGINRFWLEQRPTAEGNVDPVGRSSRYIGYQGCLTSTSSARYLTAWIKRLALIEAQRRERLKTLHAVYEAIAHCVEDAIIAEFDFEEDDIVFEFSNDVRVPFRSLSDGQRSMAAIAADIAMRCSQLNPHLSERAFVETPGIVLIDELDLHLHPHWQRGVIEDLSETFPRLQFIATSHSPFIIQSLSRGGVINLDQGDDVPETPEVQSIEDVAENIMGVDLPQQSQRFQKMMAVAEKYYHLIESGSTEKDSEKIKILRDQLDELEEPFADNPAYVAFLRLQRTAKVGPTHAES